MKLELASSKVYQVSSTDMIMLVNLVENAADGYQLLILLPSGALIR